MLDRMTLTQVRTMFEVAQVWDAVNTVRDEANGPRTLLKIETKKLIWSNEAVPQLWMPFPKASDVIEARDGYLSFMLVVGDREGSVTLTRRPEKAEIFAVLHEVEGENCVLCWRGKFMHAMIAAEEKVKRDPQATLSIFSTTRGILVLPAKDGKPTVFTRQVTAAERTGRPESFYVAQLIVRDEHVLHTRDRFADAMSDAKREVKRKPPASISICSTTRGILALFGNDGCPVFARTVTDEEIAEVTKTRH